MPGDLPDLRAVQSDVREGPIVELRELLHGTPVTPPRGERPDEGSEVHFRCPCLLAGLPIAAPDTPLVGTLDQKVQWIMTN
jgi:hypothetical protein